MIAYGISGDNLNNLQKAAQGKKTLKYMYGEDPIEQSDKCH